MSATSGPVGVVLGPELFPAYVAGPRGHAEIPTPVERLL